MNTLFVLSAKTSIVGGGDSKSLIPWLAIDPHISTANLDKPSMPRLCLKEEDPDSPAYDTDYSFDCSYGVNIRKGGPARLPSTTMLTVSSAPVAG
jgi:hypothetical protein